jgi:putative alpha-1,2-mannosidase
LSLENGKQFIIEAEDNSPSNVYVNSVSLDGAEYDLNWLNHDDIMKGGKLQLRMSATENRQRGIDAASRPYSMSKK